MILGVLGSDRLVTPTNAVLTEVFTGVRPDKVVVLAEEQPKADVAGLKEVLAVFGLSPEISVKVLGHGIRAWKDGLREVDMDLADVTPGRKYMAYAVLEHSKAKEVRYVYLKEESRGYHVFGYVPFSEVKVYNMRTWEEVPFDPPRTATGLEMKSKLSPEGLSSLMNLYSLLGEVEVDYSKDPNIRDKAFEEGEKLCRIRAGFLRFKEEEEVKRLAEDSYFMADTNVYINLGVRLSRLVWAKRSFKLLPSKSVFKELLEKTSTTQRDEAAVKFHLGMDAFREVHRSPPAVDKSTRFGDEALKEEIIALKPYLPENLVLITGDKGLANSARSWGVKHVLLSELRESGEGDWGEFVSCIKHFANVEIRVDGKLMAAVRRSWEVSRETEVEAKDLHYNYPKLLERLEEFLGRKRED